MEGPLLHGYVELFFTVEKAYRLLCKICVESCYFNTMKEYIDHSLRIHRGVSDVANLTGETINNSSIDCDCLNNEDGNVNVIIQPWTKAYQIHCCTCGGHYVFDIIEDFISHSLERHNKPLETQEKTKSDEPESIVCETPNGESNLETNGTVRVLEAPHNAITHLGIAFENSSRQGQQGSQLFEILLLPYADVSLNDYDGCVLTEIPIDLISYQRLNFIGVDDINSSLTTTQDMMHPDSVEENGTLEIETIECEADLNQSLPNDICGSDNCVDVHKLDITDSEVTADNEEITGSITASRPSSAPMNSGILESKDEDMFAAANNDVPNEMQRVNLGPMIKIEENASFENIIETCHINDVARTDINDQLPLSVVINDHNDDSENKLTENDVEEACGENSKENNNKTKRKRKVENVNSGRPKKRKILKQFDDSVSYSNSFEHIKEVHPLTECSLCNTEIKNVQEMLQHLGIHSDEVQCPLCNEEIVWYVEKHLRKHFILLSCNKCEFFACDKNVLQLHKMTCGQFVCNICKEVCKNSITYRRHALSCHDIREPFECVQCEQKFRFMNAMRVHQKICQGAQSNSEKLF